MQKTEKVAHIKKVTYVSVLVSLFALVGRSELCWSCFDEGLISGSLCSSSSENSVGSIIEVGVGRRSGLNLLSESNLKPQSSQLLTLCRGWCQVNACVCSSDHSKKRGQWVFAYVSWVLSAASMQSVWQLGHSLYKRRSVGFSRILAPLSDTASLRDLSASVCIGFCTVASGFVWTSLLCLLTNDARD